MLCDLRDATATVGGLNYHCACRNDGYAADVIAEA